MSALSVLSLQEKFDLAVEALDESALLALSESIHKLPVKVRFDALVVACRKGWHEGVVCLLAHANPKRANSAPLMEAASAGHEGLVRLLIPLSHPHVNKSQALRVAMSLGRSEVVAQLLCFATAQDIALGVADSLKSLADSKALAARFKEAPSVQHRIEQTTQALLHCLPFADLAGALTLCLARTDGTSLRELDVLLVAASQQGVLSDECWHFGGGPASWREELPLTHIHWQARQLEQSTPPDQSLGPARPRL